MMENNLRKMEVETLVKIARKINRERIKWPRSHPLRERNRGRMEGYMEAARYLDGRILSNGFKRKHGIPA